MSKKVLLKRRIPRAALMALGAIVALPIILILRFAVTTAREPGGYLNRVPFDSVTWKESLAQNSDSRVRQSMVRDLLASRLLSGKTRPEVLELLGQPPPTDKFRILDFVYWLGPQRGVPIDSEWLVIKLGAEGKVAGSKVIGD